MNDLKWYQEKTFVLMMRLLFLIGITTILATSLIDKQMNLTGLYFIAFMPIVALLKYFMRNKK